MSGELQDIKDELAGLASRMGNVEGYFDNFSVTLENHMTDYSKKQRDMEVEIKLLAKGASDLERRFAWGFWVIFGLLTAVIGAFITGLTILLQYLLSGI